MRIGDKISNDDIAMFVVLYLCLLFCIYECYDCYAVVVPVHGAGTGASADECCSVVHMVPLTVPISNIINNDDDVVLFVVLYLL